MLFCLKQVFGSGSISHKNRMVHVHLFCDSRLSRDCLHRDVNVCLKTGFFSLETRSEKQCLTINQANANQGEFSCRRFLRAPALPHLCRLRQSKLVVLLQVSVLLFVFFTDPLEEVMIFFHSLGGPNLPSLEKAFFHSCGAHCSALSFYIDPHCRDHYHHY